LLAIAVSPEDEDEVVAPDVGGCRAGWLEEDAAPLTEEEEF